MLIRNARGGVPEWNLSEHFHDIGIARDRPF